jgi:hypothetical protein
VADDTFSASIVNVRAGKEQAILKRLIGLRFLYQLVRLSERMLLLAVVERVSLESWVMEACIYVVTRHGLKYICGEFITGFYSIWT